MQSGHSQLAPALTVVVGASIWGLLWLPLRGLEEAGMGQLWPVVMFHLPAFAISCIVFAARFGSSRGRMGPVVSAGILAGLSIATYSVALILTTVVRATMLFYLTPVWGTLIGMFWLGERPGPVRFLVLALGTAGLLLLLGAMQEEGLGDGISIGDALGLLSGILWALAAAVLKKNKDLPVTGVSFFQYLVTVSSVLAAALLLPSAGAAAAEWSWEPATFMYMASSLLILASVYALLHALSLLSPGRSGLLMMSEVIVAIFSASILLPEETLEAAQWIGAGAIVLAALAEIAVDDQEDRPAETASARNAGHPGRHRPPRIFRGD